MKDIPIVITQEFNASVEAVWSAITDREQMIQWYFDIIPEFEPIVGFETSFNIHHNGNDYLHLWKVLEVIPEQKIVYGWRYGGYMGDSYVVWELTVQNEKTLLKLFHYGHNSFPQDNPDFSRESCILGWEFFIHQRLKEYLDGIV